jgi:RNA polymerase sigma-70 factor, ECF subfamily
VLVLPAGQRAALVLRELEGLSYEQIAQALGVTIPAVKGRITAPASGC